mmetsp:Transcript_364/g.721  ORF Transcript_364/g.721 Transcript_364/m.721 type:complete len:90 (+) Transcript_364:1404-1673(+)
MKFKVTFTNKYPLPMAKKLHVFSHKVIKGNMAYQDCQALLQPDDECFSTASAWVYYLFFLECNNDHQNCILHHGPAYECPYASHRRFQS